MGLRTRLAKIIASKLLLNSKIRRSVFDLLSKDNLMLFKDMKDHSVIFFPNDVIGRELVKTGEFARHSVRDLRTLLVQHEVFQAGMTVLEVGANIGTHTIYFFRDLDCSDVIALEPDPQNFRLHGHNMALNELSNKVRALEVAASDQTGTALFNRNLVNRGESRLSDGATFGQETEAFSVGVVTVDSLLPLLDQKPEEIGLVWMDVEGHELAALRGMKALIEIHSPPIFFEYSPLPDKTAMQELRDLLFRNYEFIYVYSDRFELITGEDFSQISKQVDLLAV